MIESSATQGSPAALALRILGVLVPFGTVLVVWAHVYYRIVTTPMPPNWTIANVEYAGLGAAAVLGVLARGLSRRVIPVALGGAVGILGGSYRACVSDITISAWQRVECGLVGLYPAWLLVTFTGVWVFVHLVVRRVRVRRYRAA
jgi:hypothetical protein